MPDPIVPAAPAAPAVPPAAPNKGQPSETDPDNKASEFVAREDFEKLVERLNAQSAIIENLRKSSKKPDTPADPPKQPDTLTDRVKALEEREQKAKDREARQKEREAHAKVKAALIDGGVDAKHADRFARLLQVEQTGKIQVDDDMNVTYLESEDKAVAVGDWVRAYLSTDEGKALMPPKRNPSSDGLNGGTVAANGVRFVTQADLAEGRVNTADILAGKVQVK